MNKTTSTLIYLGGIHVLHHAGEPDVYNGSDPETGDFTLIAGSNNSEVDVSTAHATALAETFPGCFQIDGETIGEKPSKKTKPSSRGNKAEDEQPAADEPDGTSDEEQTDEGSDNPAETPEPSDEELHGQLMAHTRSDLDAAAKKLKVKDADKLPNKAAVVDAIIAAKKAAA